MSTSRRIRLDHLEHRQPIPVGVQRGGIVFSSAITGKDPATGERPQDPSSQIAVAFRNLVAFFEAAGVAPEDAGMMTVFLHDLDDRVHLNREWEAMYPDPDGRPARHVILSDLDRLHEGMRIQILVMCVPAHAGP